MSARSGGPARAAASAGRLGADELEELLEVTRRLASPYDLNAMLAAVVDAARKVLHAERGSVFLYDATSNELVLKVATGLAPIRIPADRGIVGQCAQTRRLINVPDCYQDPRFNPEVDRKHARISGIDIEYASLAFMHARGRR